MDTEQMREVLRTYYGPGSPFGQRITNMRNEQIQAIYLRLKNKGVLK